jgi:hypothetical protein
VSIAVPAGGNTLYEPMMASASGGVLATVPLPVPYAAAAFQQKEI